MTIVPTRHFLLRYLERVEGIDLNAIASEVHGRVSARWSDDQKAAALDACGFDWRLMYERVAPMLAGLPENGGGWVAGYFVRVRGGKAVTLAECRKGLS